MNILSTWASQVVLVVNNSSANAGDIGDKGSILESGISPGVGNGILSGGTGLGKDPVP